MPGQAGKKIVTLRIATSESWGDARSGERMERTEWHRLVVFNEGRAGIAEKRLTKGAKVPVEGKLVTNKWKDHDGNDRSTTEIQVQAYSGTLTFLDFRKRSDERASGETGEGATREPGPAGDGAPWEPESRDMDNVPF